VSIQHWILPIWYAGFVLTGFVGGIFIQRTKVERGVGMAALAAVAGGWPLVLTAMLIICVTFIPMAAGAWVGKLVSRKKDPAQ